MAIDKNCKWHFENQTGIEYGPNDSMTQYFKKSPYVSLIRESIQNSLDAVEDISLPVNVSIDTKKLRAIDFPSFFALKEHIEGCMSYFHDNGKAGEVFGPMLPYLDDSSGTNSINYIRVSDTNTKGMAYVQGDTNCPFYAFVQSRGVSAKGSQVSGGSYGFGKAAYFNMSPIRSVFVSTMLPGGEQVFQGVAALCTHEYKGEKKTSVGYYDNNNGQPVTNPDNIPSVFKRKEPGTSICIMGIGQNDNPEILGDMIDAVLRNFWMAILTGHLTVSLFGELIIDRHNLEQLMSERFQEELDTATWSHLYNPRPYLEAIKNSNSEDHISDSLPILGAVDFYICRNPEATDKIVYMRKPLMTVYCKKTQTYYGFNGVIVCLGESGNKYLREVENTAHDEWKAENWRDSSGKIVRQGKEALEELQKFIADAIDRLFSKATDDSLDITGLEEYLYVPEDLTDKSDYLSDHQMHDADIGFPTGEYKDDGASVTTTISNISPDMIPTRTSQLGHVVIKQQGRVRTDLRGTMNVGIGNEHNGSNRKISKPAAGQHFSFKEVDRSDSGSFLEYIPVSFRVVAEMENGYVYHSIIFHSPKASDRGEIELIIGGEQTDEIPEISEVLTKPSGIRGNYITNLKIREGKNVVKFRFSDNMKHAIILKAYERR